MDPSPCPWRASCAAAAWERAPLGPRSNSFMLAIPNKVFFQVQSGLPLLLTATVQVLATGGPHSRPPGPPPCPWGGCVEGGALGTCHCTSPGKGQDTLHCSSPSPKISGHPWQGLCWTGPPPCQGSRQGSGVLARAPQQGRCCPRGLCYYCCRGSSRDPGGPAPA